MALNIKQLNRKSNLLPYRTVEIRRRLDDGTGNYETDWVDISDDIVSFGTVSWHLDTETVGVFTQSTITLVGDNTDKKWDSELQPESLFTGYLTRYKTLFRVTIGLKDGSTDVTGSVFYGILTDDITLTETEAIIVVNSLTEVFREQKASGLSLNATDTASDIVDKVLALQDNTGNVIFDRFITGDDISVTTTQYVDAVAPEEQSCWEVINRVCLTEDHCAYVGNNGSFYFSPKTSGTAIAWKFNGAGIYDEDYGVNVAKIEQSNHIWTKIYNQVVIEHTDGSYGTAGDTWSQGDASSSDKYGERILSFDEYWLGSDSAPLVAGSLYANYKDPKREVVLTSSTFNPDLKLLDRVEVNYYGENSTPTPGVWGVSVFGTAYSYGVGLWTGKTGGIYLDGVSMNIIGIDLDLDDFVSTFSLREV